MNKDKKMLDFSKARILANLFAWQVFAAGLFSEFFSDFKRVEPGFVYAFIFNFLKIQI